VPVVPKHHCSLKSLGKSQNCELPSLTPCQLNQNDDMVAWCQQCFKRSPVGSKVYGSLGTTRIRTFSAILNNTKNASQAVDLFSISSSSVWMYLFLYNLPKIWCYSIIQMFIYSWKSLARILLYLPVEIDSYSWIGIYSLPLLKSWMFVWLYHFFKKRDTCWVDYIMINVA
jgi:hypothetical protein